MMWPGSRVVVGPKPCVDLRDDHLHVPWPKFVDFFCEHCRSVNTVRADFDLPTGVPGNDLVRIDGFLEFLGIAGDSMKSKRNRDNVIRERRHLLRIVETKLALLVKRRIQHPDSELRQLVELDLVAVE